MILSYDDIKKLIEESNLYQIPQNFNPTGWELSGGSCKFLAYLIKETGAKKVLEFGSGYSSIVIAQELKKENNGKLISIDNSMLWSQKVESQENRNLGKIAELCVFHLKARIYHKKLLIFYDIPKNFYEKYSKFDLVLVDGPHHDVGREAAMYDCFEQVKKGGIFIIDDSSSDHMQKTIRKWQKGFGDLIAISDFREFGHGICIITKKEELANKILFPSKELLVDGLKTFRNILRVNKLHLNQ